jgi:integrase
VERDHNKETKILAENVCAQRQLQIQSSNYGFIDKTKRNLDFLQYFKDLAENRKTSKGNYDNWLSSYNYLVDFAPTPLPMSSVTESFCNEFKNHLLTTKTKKSDKARLSQNAAHSYFNKFKAAVSQAYRDGLLNVNPIDRIDGIKQADTQREFLTQEELDKLVKTDCDPPLLKNASLFAVLTGLRWSDVTALTWRQVQHSESSGYFIRFIQKKTKGSETHPISDTAFSLLGERKEDSQRPFDGLTYSAWLNMKLKLWVGAAGIKKNITFHCFRHTYATLQLSQGTDIFTVSKLLGHRDVKTTQIYTKIIDQKKKEAADKIKIDLK